MATRPTCSIYCHHVQVIHETPSNSTDVGNYRGCIARGTTCLHAPYTSTLPSSLGDYTPLSGWTWDSNFKECDSRFFPIVWEIRWITFRRRKLHFSILHFPVIVSRYLDTMVEDISVKFEPVVAEYFSGCIILVWTTEKGESSLLFMCENEKSDIVLDSAMRSEVCVFVWTPQFSTLVQWRRHADFHLFSSLYFQHSKSFNSCCLRLIGGEIYSGVLCHTLCIMYRHISNQSTYPTRRGITRVLLRVLTGLQAACRYTTSSFYVIIQGKHQSWRCCPDDIKLKKNLTYISIKIKRKR